MKKKRNLNVAGASHASKVSSSRLSAHIKRGILTSFDPVSYTANVLILEATNAFIQGVPLSYHMDGTSALVNNLCAVLFFDAQNYTDAVILAIYPGAGVGAPTYPPGRLTFVPTFKPLNNVTILSGNFNTYTVSGSNNIPVGALAIVYHAYFQSGTLGAYISLNAPGAGHQVSMGNITTINVNMNGTGVLPLDAGGRFDISANGGDCIVTLYIYGYII